MPRYFFHLLDGVFDPDPEGIDLPDLQRAKCEAVVYAGQVISDQPDIVWKDGEIRVEVTSEVGVLVATIIVQAVEAPLVETLKKRLAT